MNEEINEAVEMEDQAPDVGAMWDEEDTAAAEQTSDAEEPAEGTEQTSEGPEAEGEARRESDQATRPDRSVTDQPETFTLKHLDEVRTVGKDEVVTLAQKGMDYDRVRAERDRLRTYRDQMEQAVKGQEGSGLDPAAAREAAAQRDREAFLDAYPDVKATDIPPEVWAKVRSGESLVSAYTMYQNQQLKAQIAAQEQNRQNAGRTPGSMKSQGEKGRKSLSDFWDEAEE